jgi:diadenosine tetraphosphate (Ap4A) HIT family hydrolase
MTTAIHRLVEVCRAAAHPPLVCRIPSGWLVMGETQITPGYCLLLPDPVVPHLNALRGDSRARFLEDMAVAGDAILHVTGAVRINYEMLGNLEPALHAHILPRYADEPESLRTQPVWLHDWATAPRYTEAQYGPLRNRLRATLASIQ